MARLFDDGSSEYLFIASTPITAYPLTMACWFYSDDATAEQTLIQVTDTAGGSDYWALTLRGDLVGDHIEARVRRGDFRAHTLTGYSVNTWHHACGVFINNNSRASYIDGGSKGTSAGISNDASIDAIAIGGKRDSSPGDYTSGRICEVALWNVALTDAEVAILAKGYSPLFVHPQNLVAYWPLIRDEDQDRVGGYDMGAFNTPSIAAHTRVFYPVTVQPAYLKDY